MPNEYAPIWQHYLAYGTLMAGNERHHIIEPYVTHVRDVTIGGSLYNYHDSFPMWYRYGGGFTEAELYRVLDNEIELADFYEMLDEIEAEGVLFLREDQLVVFEDPETGFIEEYTAVIYEGIQKVMENLITIPSGNWNSFKAANV